jgi:hypothetical protein
MAEQYPAGSVEETLLPHLDAAYNLARWLTRSPADTEDVVQDPRHAAVLYLCRVEPCGRDGSGLELLFVLILHRKEFPLFPFGSDAKKVRFV